MMRRMPSSPSLVIASVPGGRGATQPMPDQLCDRILDGSLAQKRHASDDFRRSAGAGRQEGQNARLVRVDTFGVMMLDEGA